MSSQTTNHMDASHISHLRGCGISELCEITRLASFSHLQFCSQKTQLNILWASVRFGLSLQSHISQSAQACCHLIGKFSRRQSDAKERAIAGEDNYPLLYSLTCEQKRCPKSFQTLWSSVVVGLGGSFCFALDLIRFIYLFDWVFESGSCHILSSGFELTLQSRLASDL